VKSHIFLRGALAKKEILIKALDLDGKDIKGGSFQTLKWNE